MGNAFLVTLGVGLGILLILGVAAILLWARIAIAHIKEQGWKN